MGFEAENLLEMSNDLTENIYLIIITHQIRIFVKLV